MKLLMSHDVKILLFIYPYYWRWTIRLFLVLASVSNDTMNSFIKDVCENMQETV